MDLGLKNKVVIITGGARGIGAGITEVFAQEGSNIIMNYHTHQEESEAYAKELSEKYGVKIVPVQGDVGKEEDILKLFDEAYKQFGTVDCLINNAYPFGNSYGAFENFNVETYRRSEQGSVEAVMIGCRELIKHCKEEQKDGHIVNVLSKACFWTSSFNNSDYITNKGAIASLTRGLAHEFAKERIWINGIIPGFVHNSRFNPETADYKRRANLIPLKRFAEPIEMGYMCAFLCSDKSAQTNGTFIDCTGCMMAGQF